MAGKSLYRKYAKIGPGGISCPCCKIVPYGKNNSRKTNKQYLNRLFRKVVIENGED